MGPSRSPGRVFPTIDNGMKGAAIDTGSAPRALAPGARAQFGEQDGRAILVDCIPRFATGQWRLQSCRTLEVHEQRRKRILICEITYQEGTDSTSIGAIVLIKLYGSDRGGNGHLALRSLWEAGFRAPAEHRVPRPYGYSKGWGALVQERVGGTPWADTLQASDGPAAASRAAAEWLLRLQQTDVEGIRRLVSDDAAEVLRFGKELGQAFPGHRKTVGSVADAVAARLDETQLEIVPSHGDLHPKNVFVRDGVTTVIDLDTFGLRERAHDVGYAMGQLLVMSRFRLGSLEPGAEAAVAFWDAYRRRGEAPWPRVTAHIGRTLLQSLHFELCTLRNGKVELLTEWPELADRWLDRAEPGPR